MVLKIKKKALRNTTHLVSISQNFVDRCVSPGSPSDLSVAEGSPHFPGMEVQPQMEAGMLSSMPYGASAPPVDVNMRTSSERVWCSE